jgi:translation initiation factor IF-1
MEKRMSDERLELEGQVIETSNSKFRVKVSDNYIVLCTLSGKIRQNSVRILVGDNVRIEVSPYDVSQGRIIFRNKN